MTQFTGKCWGFLPSFRGGESAISFVFNELGFWHGQCMLLFQPLNNRQAYGQQYMMPLNMPTYTDVQEPAGVKLTEIPWGYVMPETVDGIPVRFVNIPMDRQIAALRGRTKATSARPKTTYETVWSGHEHGLIELIDVRRAGTDEEQYIALTVKAAKSSTTGAINIALHHKFLTNHTGEYLDRAKSKNLAPDEMERGLTLVAKFMATVGTPDDDPLGFYTATGYDMSIQPGSADPVSIEE